MMIAHHLLMASLAPAPPVRAIAATLFGEFKHTSDKGASWSAATLPSGFTYLGGIGRPVSAGGPGAVAVAIDDSFVDLYFIRTSDQKNWTLGAWIATQSDRDVHGIHHLADGSLIYGEAWSEYDSGAGRYIYHRPTYQAPGDGCGGGTVIYPPNGDDPDGRAWIYAIGSGFAVIRAGSYFWLYDGTTWTQMTAPASGWPQISGAGAEHTVHQIGQNPSSGTLSFRGTYSTDGGSTWSEGYDPADPPNVYATAYSDGNWLRIDADGRIEWSSDASTWSYSGNTAYAGARWIEVIGASFYWQGERVPVSGASDVAANATTLPDEYRNFAG